MNGGWPPLNIKQITRCIALVALLVVAGCATTAGHHDGADAEAVSIGPYPALTGRLVVIEPNRRWQVLLSWRASQPERGWLRITHAASGVVIELRWHQQQMLLRDNRDPDWRLVTSAELSEQGIILPPQEMAAILLGQMPARFVRRNASTWESHTGTGIVRLQWQADAHRLTMTDLKHGRRAMLLIDS